MIPKNMIRGSPDYLDFYRNNSGDQGVTPGPHKAPDSLALIGGEMYIVSTPFRDLQ